MFIYSIYNIAGHTNIKYSVFVLMAAWWMDVFAPVDITAFERDSCYIVTLLEPDSPVHLQSQIETVRNFLVEHGRQPMLPVGVYYHDPLSAGDFDAAEASGGWLVKDSLQVDSPFILLATAKETVARTTLKINPIIGRYKAYPVLKNWIEREGYQPARHSLVMELFHAPDSLEIQIPITRAGYDSLTSR